LQGGGWLRIKLRIELRSGQSDSYFPKLFFLFLFVFIGFFSGRFAVSTDIISDATMSLHPYSTFYNTQNEGWQSPALNQHKN
jgi:hypothetical protein